MNTETEQTHTYKTVPYSRIYATFDNGEFKVANVEREATFVKEELVGYETAFNLEEQLPALEEVAERAQEEYERLVRSKEKNPFTVIEQRYSALWYEKLTNVPAHLQENTKFWLYLTLRVWGNYLQQAEKSKKKDGSKYSFGRHDGSLKRDDAFARRLFVMGRMFTRYSRTDETLATEKNRSNWQEFSSSHLLVGTIKPQEALQAAYLRHIAGKTQDEARKFIKSKVNPVRETIVPELLTLEEADEVIKRLCDKEAAKTCGPKL